MINIHGLGFHEDDKTVTLGQKKYIDRIVKAAGGLKEIPRELSRKRAETLFSPEISARGYLRLFSKIKGAKNSFAK